MAMATSSAEDGDVMVDINTTPLIDVMLVLLIMLIITIPIQTHAVKLNMPVDSHNAPPPKPPCQPRDVERIDNGRPQEFDRVGQTDQGEQADGAEIDSAVGHPHRQRLAGQRQRQPRREPEQHHDQHARPEIDGHRVEESGGAAAPGVGWQGHVAP